MLEGLRVDGLLGDADDQEVFEVIGGFLFVVILRGDCSDVVEERLLVCERDTGRTTPFINQLFGTY